MKAAFVCRACHRRLQTAQTWSASLHPSRPSIRGFAVGKLDIQGAAAQSSSYHDGYRTQSCRSASTLSTRPTEEDISLDRLSAGSQVVRALTQGARSMSYQDERPRGRPRSGRSRNTPKPADEYQEARQRSDSKRARGKSDAKKKAAAVYEAKVESRRKARYFQWGKVRHLYPESQLQEARKAFNFWKGKIALLQRRKSLSKMPWIEDGRWLFTLETEHDIRAAWEKLDVGERQKMWPRMMISTLYLDITAAPRVLSATIDPLPPGYALSDVLYLLAKHIQERSGAKRAAIGDALFPTLLHLLQDLPAGHMPFDQRTWGILASVLSTEQSATIYGVLKSSNAMLHPNTSLQFARKLAGGPTDGKHKESAFSILQKLADGGLDLSKPQAASVMTALLHSEDTKKTSSDEGHFSVTRALHILMERGFLPNAVTFTSYLDTLVQRREVDEAIRLARLFSNTGLKLDDKSYATVFRGAKHSSDVEHVRQVLSLSKAMDVSPVEVLNNALHTIFCYSETEIRDKKISPSEDQKPFLPMLRIYAKKFDLEPLQSLIPESLPLLLMRQPGTQDGQSNTDEQPTLWTTEQTVVPIVDEFVSASGSRRLQPNSTTLATMLRAYIRSLWRPYDLMSLYAYFKSQLGGHGGKENYAMQIVRNQRSLVHDTLILAMMQQPGLTRPALDIFGDMLKDSLRPGEPTADVDAKVGNPTVGMHPAPTIFTFGILVNGLMRRRETELAQQILGIMKENNIESNVVTWNSQIKWWAVMQNVPQTVGALQDLEASGFKPDEHTFRAFGRLRDQDRALEMMERIIDLNKQKAGSRGQHGDGAVMG